MSENYGNGPAAPAYAKPRREYFTKRQTLMVAASTVVAAALGVGCVFAAQDAFGVARSVTSAAFGQPAAGSGQTGAGAGSGSGYGYGGGQLGQGGQYGYGGGGSAGSGSAGGSSDPFGGSQYGGSQSGSQSGSSASGASETDATSAESRGVVLINTELSYENEEAAGTGMILTSNGEVLTNNHVIEGSTTVQVQVVSTGKTYTAKVVGDDPTDDVAVLQLQNASGLTTAKVDSSANVKTSDKVTGVGNAEGGEKLVAAPGSVTGLNKSITTEAEDTVASESLHGLIETDAGIQPGDSGGPLYNAAGKIVGMDTAAASGGPTDGYAIPISSALSIAKQIESGDSSSKIELGYPAFLGVELPTDASSGSSSSGSGDGSGFNGGYGFGDGSGSGFGGGSGEGQLGGGDSQFGDGSSDGGSSTGSAGSTVSGAQIAGVTAGGPAEQAGLAAGDTITAVGGTSVSSTTALQTAIKGYQPGDKVSVTWTDTSGQSHTATLTLTTGPAA
ncbi:S1C family serine protease [Gryllotalpicola reticulitermitis]|uniref:S1C family serine protease n=1 Tax=Gryllotalpicola reticulitermitis TaxID=1184153 RepID=A0ABV8Q4X3_9MICO